MDTRLNFFSPYERSPAWHENQLTRALLVVLRYSPAAHESWLRVVAPDHQLHALARPTFATQRQRVLEPNGSAGQDEAIPGISVWLAPDAEKISAAVEIADRNQILDGIITYGSDLVVVVENKVTPTKVTEQPGRVNLHGSPVVFQGPPVSISWQRLLEVFSDLVERDDLVPNPDRMMLGDFFELVEQHFPRLGPYSTLARCRGHRFRLDRRLDAVMAAVAGTDEGKGMGWRNLSGTPKIFMAWLGMDESGTEVCLQMYPADTLGQARPFYADATSVAKVLSLRQDGWHIKPHHWGFTATGYARSESPMSVEDYCAYWIDRIHVTRELGRAEWEAYWSQLAADGIVSPEAKAEFDKEFTASKRQKANPRPGLKCECRWPIELATDLDDAGRLTRDVLDRINQMLEALKAPLLPK